MSISSDAVCNHTAANTLIAVDSLHKLEHLTPSSSIVTASSICKHLKCLLQASDKSSKAVGQQLIAEEEQAAAFVAAKKAKKLRQKANRQHDAQATLQAAAGGSSQLDPDGVSLAGTAVTPDSSQHTSHFLVA